ncbi:M6 family metalloprotease domain-containing protein [Streptomyces albus]|uniref:M6 family metalloprotease domain-containing protein n=1 Tax=Streptomyces albus TaxID=1888 RepID=UPI001FC96E04|nr:M6 family metalloprotease domain-containing protein [Streptomyces albus]
MSISMAAAPTAVPVTHPGPGAPSLAQTGAACVPGRAEGIQMSEGIPTPPGHAPSTGTLRALTLMIDFPDARGEGSARERFAEFFPATADWYETSSYGALDYRAETPVKGWLRMPRPFSSYGIERGAGYEPGYRRLIDDLAKAADDRIDFGLYDLINVLVTPNAGPSAAETVLSVSFTGVADAPRADGVPLNRISFIYSRQNDGSPGAAANAYRVLPHENAHSLGLPDLYTDDDGGNKAGHWDLMSEDWGPGNDFLGWHKRKLGWLDDGRHVECADGSGRSHHTIRPLGERDTGGDGGGWTDVHDVYEQAAADGEEGGAGREHGGKARTEPGSPGGQPGRAAPPGPDAVKQSMRTEQTEQAEQTGPGKPAKETKLVYVPVTDSTGYAVEVRTQSGNDEAVCKPGVLVYWVDTRVETGRGPVEVRDSTPASGGCARLPNVAAELTDAPFGVGERYRDARTGVAVEVTGRDPDGTHRITVTRP